MKNTKTAIVLLAILFAGMAVIPVAGAPEATAADTMIMADPATDTAGFVPVDVINIDPAIKAATPYYGMLVLSDEGKQNFEKTVDSLGTASGSGAIVSDEAKEAIRKNMSAIWKKYPVTAGTKKGGPGYPSYGGTITTITFDPKAKATVLTEEENAFLRDTASLIASASGTGGSVTPLWAGSPSHQRISYWAATKESFPYPSTVAANAPAPDSWYDSSPEPFRTVFHSINHYYSPAGIGYAPSNTQTYVNNAENYYDQGSAYYSVAATNLGYSSHFLEDVGNPMHTGREWDQFWNQWVHSNYETYVGNRWYSSNFDYVVSNNNNYYWYVDWALGTRDLAGYTNGYLDTIYTKVYNKGQNWNLAQDSSIDAVTQNVILKTAKYTNGLALYARIG